MSLAFALAFSVSVAGSVALNFGLWIFLRSQYVYVNWFRAGTPGYLDRKYIAWCRQNNRSYLVIIGLRIALFVGVVMCSVLFPRQ